MGIKSLTQSIKKCAPDSLFMIIYINYQVNE